MATGERLLADELEDLKLWEELLGMEDNNQRFYVDDAQDAAAKQYWDGHVENINKDKIKRERLRFPQKGENYTRGNTENLYEDPLLWNRVVKEARGVDGRPRGVEDPSWEDIKNLLGYAVKYGDQRKVNALIGKLALNASIGLGIAGTRVIAPNVANDPEQGDLARNAAIVASTGSGALLGAMPGKALGSVLNYTQPLRTRNPYIDTVLPLATTTAGVLVGAKSGYDATQRPTSNYGAMPVVFQDQ